MLPGSLSPACAELLAGLPLLAQRLSPSQPTSNPTQPNPTQPCAGGTGTISITERGWMDALRQKHGVQ